MPQSVSISLSSFGAQEVQARGQASFFPLVRRSGASHVELREELLDLEADLADYRRQARELGLTVVYSSPMELWQPDGNRPSPRLEQTLASAAKAGACWLKVSLGHFTPDVDLKALGNQLQAFPVRLLVENDQSFQGGRIEPLVQFFAGARTRQLPVGMTFDIGNWQWQGQSAHGAAGQLGQYVEYLHCKAVRVNPHGKLVAVPPESRDLADWALLLRRFPEGIVRAIEYPLQGTDLGGVVAQRVKELAGLGEETAHA